MVPFGTVPKVAVQLVVEAGNVDERRQRGLARRHHRADDPGGHRRRCTADALAARAGHDGRRADGRRWSPIAPTSSRDVLAERGPQALRLLADVVAAAAPARSRPGAHQGEPRRATWRSRRARRSRSRRSSSPQLTYGDHPYGRLFPTDAMLRRLHARRRHAASTRAHFGAEAGAALRRRRVRRGGDGGGRARGLRRLGGRRRRPTPAGAGGARPRGHADRSRRRAAVDRSCSACRVARSVEPGLASRSRSTDSLLGGSFASRITSNIREQKGYTYSPFSTHHHPSRRTRSGWSRPTSRPPSPAPRSRRSSPRSTACAARRRRPTSCAASRTTSPASSSSRTRSRGGLIGQLSFVDLHGLGERLPRRATSTG